MDFHHRAQTSYGQLALAQRPPVIQPSHEFPMSTPVKLEKDDSEEEIINSAQSSGSSGSPENHSTGGVSSPLDDSPLDDHPHLRQQSNHAIINSPQSRPTPSTPISNGRSPEAIVRVSPVGAPVGSHIINPSTPPRAPLSAGMSSLPTPPTNSALAGLSSNLASNVGLAAMSSLFGSALGAPNLADMANKSPEEQQQISTELQANILQLIQAVQAQAKAQQEEKVRQEEAERAAREAAQIAEFIQHELAPEQRKEMSDFLTKNPRVTVDDCSILFTAKFGKQISSRVISTMKGEPLTPLPPSPTTPQLPTSSVAGWPSNVSHMVDMFKSNQMVTSHQPSPASSPLGNKINHAFKNRNSAFPEIEQKISELFDEAEAEGRQLSSKVVRQKALEYADMLGIKNFNASKGWLLKLLARQNRKLGRSVDHLQKRKPFIRLSFGEKHEIAKYITQFPDKTYPEYARHFSELWNRTVTARQIITTKENTDKWLDEAYKGCEQTHYKFVDEGSEQDGPMVMKRKRSRVILTPDEREEISNFLADNSEMTFNQTAEIFARRWGKDVNRTHVASIMRLREKASQNANSNSNQLAIGGVGAGVGAIGGSFRKITSKPSPLSLGFGRNNQSPPSLLPQSHAHLQHHPYSSTQPQLGQKRPMPMSGLDLFNLNQFEQSPPVVHGSGLAPTSVTTLNTSSSSSSSIKTERVSSPVSVITPNSFVAKREKPDDECFDVSSFDEAKKAKIQCEKCPSIFPSQAALFQHILTAPGHRDEASPTNHLEE